jgi:hypothetical protein
MKKSIILLSIIVLSLTAFTIKSEYSVTLSEAAWASRYATIVQAQALIEKSNAPMNEAKPVMDSLQKFRMELESQLVPQFKAAADTSKPKK